MPHDYQIAEIFSTGEEGRIFIRSTKIPNHAVQFAVDHAAGIVKDHIYTDSRYYKYQNVGLQICQPFTILEASQFHAYYFPVTSNETIAFVLTYYETPSHEYRWMISEYLTEELNTLNGLTASESPATIYAFSSNKKDIILAEIGQNNIILSCSNGKAPYCDTNLEDLEKESQSMSETVDILQPFSKRNVDKSTNVLDDFYKMLSDLLSGFKDYIT